MNARFRDAPGDRERAKSGAAVSSLAREPLGTFFQDVAHPIQRFHIVLERRPSEETYLSDVRRTKPRHTAFSLDRVDLRRFLAADVGSGAVLQVDAGKGW